MPSFQITLHASGSESVAVRSGGREFTAHDHQTVLAAALAAGIILPYGCRDGACGSCKGRVTKGRVRHHAHSETALSADEAAAGLALFCCAIAESDLTIEARAAAPGMPPPRRMPARIERIERIGADVAIVQLRLPSPPPTPPSTMLPSSTPIDGAGTAGQLAFRAGQYLDVILPDGARRSYSIASAPHEDGPIELHIRHLPGGVFTDALFGAGRPALAERSVLRIEAPLGTFFWDDDARDAREPVVLLAGGTGFAPIQSIARTLFARSFNRDDPARGRRAVPVVLYWGARSRDDLYRDAMVRQWEREQPNFRYIPVLSGAVEQGSGEIFADPGQGSGTERIGLVHQAVMQDLPDLSGHRVYVCGAPAMVEAARRDFIGRCALSPERFHADAFFSLADKNLDS
jgi:CDP-4-dehydro-6-deoxyglucose reductase